MASVLQTPRVTAFDLDIPKVGFLPQRHSRVVMSTMPAVELITGDSSNRRFLDFGSEEDRGPVAVADCPATTSPIIKLY